MRTLLFLLACSTALAAPPDGYLSGPTCGLAEPVGVGISLPLHVEPADVKVEDIEQRIGAWLDRKLHYPDDVTVHCARGPENALGRFSSIEVDVRGGMLDMVPLKGGRLKLTGVTIDLGRLWKTGDVEIIGTSPAEAHLEVTEEGLNDVMTKKAEKLNVERPHIALAHDEVRFSARMRTLIIKNDVVTAGRFEIATGGKLNFHPTSLKVGFLPLPNAALRALANRFNPIMELTRLKPLKGISFAFERVIVEPGVMALETAQGDQLVSAK